MRKSSYLILCLSIISIAIGIFLLRSNPDLIISSTINEEQVTLSKGNLVLIGLVPFIVVFTMDIIATFEAEEIRPFIKYYDRLKYTICFGFQILYILIILSQLYTFNQKYIIGLILSVIIMVVGYTLPNISPNQVVGFKNRWTLSDERVWIRVHRRAGTLAYLISLISLILTFFKHIAIVGLVVGTLICSILYLIYFSYKISDH